MHFHHLYFRLETNKIVKKKSEEVESQIRKRNQVLKNYKHLEAASSRLDTKASGAGVTV